MHTSAEVALQVRTRFLILASECRNERKNEGMSRVPSPNLSPLRRIIVSEGRHRRRMSMPEPCLPPVAMNITNHSSMPRLPTSSPRTNHAKKRTKRRPLIWVPFQLSYWTGRSTCNQSSTTAQSRHLWKASPLFQTILLFRSPKSTQQTNWWAHSNQRYP